MKKVARAKWSRRRHSIISSLLKIVMAPFLSIKFAYKCQKFDNRKQPYLILCNHQTFHDQFMLGMAIKKPGYFVCSEDLLSMGRVGRIIDYLVRPIPIAKATVDINTIRICRQVIKENKSILLFPEGNTSYSGTLGYIKPSISKLVKLLKVPVLLYNIDGGYGVQPRWAHKLRHGKVQGRVVRVIEQEEYKDMSDEQLYNIIVSGLRVDNSVYDCRVYKGKNLAQYLERAIYYCPNCGFGDMYSDKDDFGCHNCGLTVRYGRDKQFHSNNEVPYGNVKQWYEAQSRFILGLDLDKYIDKVIYSRHVDVNNIINKSRVPLMRDQLLNVYGDRITIGDTTYSYTDIDAMAMQGRNKVVMTISGKSYQIVSDVRFCGLLIVNTYYSYKRRESNECEFLGL